MVKAARRAYVTAKDNPPHPTWQWIFTTAIMLVAAILGYIVVTMSDVRVSLGVIGEIVTRVEASQTSHQNDPAKHGPR